MVVALPALAEILFWVGALIFCLLCVYITKALFKAGSGAFGWIPGIGGWIKGELHTIEQRIVHVMSEAATAVDARIGDAWHRLARIVDWVGREIKSHANLLAMLAALIVGTPTNLLVRTVAGELRRLIHAASAAVPSLWHRLASLEHRLTHALGADVLPRLRAIDRALDHVIARDIPGLRTRERTLARDLTALRKWVRAHTVEAGSLAFAGAVAVALGRLGIGWARCNNVGRLGKAACGMNPNLLESLLAGALVVAGPISIVELARECQRFESTVEDAARFFVRELS